LLPLVLLGELLGELSLFAAEIFASSEFLLLWRVVCLHPPQSLQRILLDISDGSFTPCIWMHFVAPGRLGWNKHQCKTYFF
jgi:hypothetical protein